MILYTDNNDKVYCIKCNRPKFRAKNAEYNSLDRYIDGNETSFFIHTKSNAGYFYFLFNGQYYKATVWQKSGIDLWDYFEKISDNLYTSRQDIII